MLRPDDLQLRFVAEPVQVREGLQRMLALPPLAGLPPAERGTAELVLAEVLNNVVEHAYAEGSGTVEVTLSAVGTDVRCLVVDQGKAMPGGVLPAGRLPGGPETALDDLPEGGFGWHLIRSLTHELTYARVGDENRLGFLLAREE